MDPEIARAAQTFADHALLLLASGILLIGAALATVLAATRLGGRHHTQFLAAALWISRQIHRLPVLVPSAVSAPVAIPTRYVALHLALGLVATAAVVAFAVIAEQVVAGREVAVFDVAFAEALQNGASPRWQEVFSIITWLGFRARTLERVLQNDIQDRPARADAFLLWPSWGFPSAQIA